jgi:phosphoglycerate dehydrogenase-like enzyme
LERGISVTSAAAANAAPVAEFTLTQILLANKGYFRNVGEYLASDSYERVFRGRGNYGATVAILGAGQIGRLVIQYLRPFHPRVIVFDPFLSHKVAEHLGVEKVETLEEAFARGHIVSNHLADLPATYGLLRGSHSQLMPPSSTFINTGRGRTLDHDELLVFMQERPDVRALLDVTAPEPLPLDHPLRALPNVHVSGHIAGSIGDETVRLADFAIEEFEAWTTGQPLRHAEAADMLATMA